MKMASRWHSTPGYCGWDGSGCCSQWEEEGVDMHLGADCGQATLPSRDLEKEEIQPRNYLWRLWGWLALCEGCQSQKRAIYPGVDVFRPATAEQKRSL